nr:PAS domain-containing sensor histidine kinase [Metabacillus litoralis]
MCRTDINLLALNENLDRIFETALSGMLLVREDGRIMKVNQAGCTILEIDHNKCDNLNILDYQVSGNKRHEVSLLLLRLKEKGDIHGEVTILVKGVKKYIQFSAHQDSTPFQYLFIFHDITAHKQLERRILAEEKEEKRAEKAKTEFLSMLSHELRTSLNTIMGHTQIMLEDHNELTSQQKKRIHKIKSSSEVLVTHINDILHYLKCDKRTNRKKTEQLVNIEKLFRQCIHSVYNTVNSKNILVIFESDDIEGKIVLMDPGKVKEIVKILLKNAIKCNEENGRLIVSAAIQDRTLGVWIKDDGSEKKQEVENVIFETLFPIQRWNDFEEGSDFGLAAAKKYIEELDGKYGIENKLGKGSNFWFQIPLSGYHAIIE